MGTIPNEAICASKAADCVTYCESSVVSPSLIVAHPCSGIDYDSAYGVFTLWDAGKYLVSWSLLLACVDPASSADLLIALESADGVTQYALSGAQAAPHGGSQLVVGFTVIDVGAGDTLVLRNRSACNVRFVSAACPAMEVSANFSLVRLV